MEEYQIIELDENSKLFDEFYDLYSKIFTKPEHAETRENLIKYLKYKKSGYYGKNSYHILVLIDRDKVIGFAIGDYYYNSGLAFIEFLGVHQEYRNKSLGRFVFRKFIETVENDVKALNGFLKGIVIEVENKHSEDHSDSSHFWGKLGFKKILCDYIQPSLSPDKSGSDALMLMYLPLDNSPLSKKDLLSGIHDYFKYAMSKENPENLPEFRAIERSIESEFLKLEEIL